MGAIYASRNLVGDYVLPLSLWAPHTAQLTASAIFVKLAPGARPGCRAGGHYPGRGQLRQADRGRPRRFVANAGQAVSTVLAIVYALLVLAIVIAVSGITNTLSLSVYERTREIGLLRAVGQTRPQLRSMVRLESVLVAAFGTVGGLAPRRVPGLGAGRGRRPVLGADPAQLPGGPAAPDRRARRAGRRHRRHPPGPPGGPAAAAGAIAAD